MFKRAPVVDVPETTPKADKSKSKSKKAPVVLTGYEKLVDLLATKKSEIEAADGVISHARTSLDPLVSSFRDRLEKDGEFTKTVQVAGTSANATYTFKDSFAKIDTSVEDSLQKLLGSHYDDLFERKKSISVKPNAMEQLLALAKKHGFEDLLQQDEYLQPAADFRKRRYEKRPVLSSAQNKALDDVVKQVGSTPALSFK